MANTENLKSYTFYYRAYFYTFRAVDVSDARRQVREELSAQADREAFLTKVE